VYERIESNGSPFQLELFSTTLDLARKRAVAARKWFIESMFNLVFGQLLERAFVHGPPGSLP
jgi:hypothetical protein